MALNQNINVCTSALLLLALVTFSQFLASQGRPLPIGGYVATVNGRNLLSHASGSVPKEGMVEGTVTPSYEIHDDKGSIVGASDVRPTTPGSSPGIGHAFINKNGPGRKL
ncbi:hypothetical protein HU200_018190 [Digitaria exilis]|uniref:Uncharacterized protein n=1 Tax=Digitaria exilis TaxID=1010633 RepID=A0A835KF61_9POAL|nr:hypothetical protein HU200_018190 [Digitaria exilis]